MKVFAVKESGPIKQKENSFLFVSSVLNGIRAFLLCQLISLFQKERLLSHTCKVNPKRENIKIWCLFINPSFISIYSHSINQ